MQQVELAALLLVGRLGLLHVLDQLVELRVLRVDVRALVHAGQEAACQFCDSWIGYPPGRGTTKPGRFWFSLPQAVVTHEPMLGRMRRASPQFISSSDGSWFGTSACIERMTHRFVGGLATCGNSSEISSRSCRTS
jgi:hypothetical protein